jgi:hypothetical protein
MRRWTDLTRWSGLTLYSACEPSSDRRRHRGALRCIGCARARQPCVALAGLEGGRRGCQDGSCERRAAACRRDSWLWRTCDCRVSRGGTVAEGVGARRRRVVGVLHVAAAVRPHVGISTRWAHIFQLIQIVLCTAHFDPSTWLGSCQLRSQTLRSQTLRARLISVCCEQSTPNNNHPYV